MSSLGVQPIRILSRIEQQAYDVGLTKLCRESESFGSAGTLCGGEQTACFFEASKTCRCLDGIHWPPAFRGTVDAAI